MKKDGVNRVSNKYEKTLDYFIIVVYKGSINSMNVASINKRVRKDRNILLDVIKSIR